MPMMHGWEGPFLGVETVFGLEVIGIYAAFAGRSINQSDTKQSGVSGSSG